MIVRKYIVPFKLAVTKTTENILFELEKIYEKIKNFTIHSIDMVKGYIIGIKGKEKVVFSYPDMKLVKGTEESFY